MLVAKERCLGWEFLFLLKMFIHPGSMLIFRGVIILVVTSASWGVRSKKRQQKHCCLQSHPPKARAGKSQILESSLVLGLMW